MRIFPRINRFSTPLALMLFFTGILYLWAQGPILQADTGSYLSFSPTRSFIYPLILKINQLVFGPEKYHWLILFQLGLGFFAAIHFALKLKKIFGLENWAVFCVVGVLLSPYYGMAKFGNAILTEGLCYPLFLLCTACLLTGIFDRNVKALLQCMGLTALLVLTRRQFLFLYPVLGLVLIYLRVNAEKSLKWGMLFTCFLSSIVITNLIERTEHYISHDRFSTIPFTGIQLIVAPLYIADKNDAALFQDEKQKQIFQKTFDNMTAKKINITALQTNTFLNISTYTHFYENYNKICWETLSPVLGDLGFHDWHDIDQITTSMAIKLIQNHWQNFFKLYLMNIIFNLGGLYLSLFLSLLFIAALLSYQKSKNPLSLLCLITLLLNAANYTAVALVEPVMRRYSAYTDTILISMLLVVCLCAFKSTCKQT